MKGVVPAAGEGTRLRPVTGDRPKGLVDVAGRPLLAHCFDRLIDLDVSTIVVVVGHGSARIVDRFGDEYRGVPIRYVHQREQLGLAHAVLAAEPEIDDDFLVLNGDNVVRGNLGAVVRQAERPDVDAAVLVDRVSVPEARRTGVCELDDDGNVVGIVEKPERPPSRLVLTGFFALSPAIFHACRLLAPSDRGEYELSEAISLLIRSGRTVVPVRLSGWRVNVNTPADLDRAIRRLEAAREDDPDG